MTWSLWFKCLWFEHIVFIDPSWRTLDCARCGAHEDMH